MSPWASVPAIVVRGRSPSSVLDHQSPAPRLDRQGGKNFLDAPRCSPGDPVGRLPRHGRQGSLREKRGPLQGYDHLPGRLPWSRRRRRICLKEGLDFLV
jgi:hypothetical protein